MILQKIIKWGNANPKKLFLVDGVGAITSAVMLGIVFIKFQNLIGLPKTTLYLLASFPFLFAHFDFYCFFNRIDQLGLFLRRMAYFNLLYCCLSIGLAIYHQNEITLLGWVYIFLEVIIILVLSFIEYQVAKNWTQKN